jgi:hypothetical protein
MKKRHLLVGALLVLAVSCASVGSLPHSTGTRVDLSRKNYRVVKANAIGQSSGFALLGIIPIASPTYPAAMSNLYENAQITEGSATALANVSQERSTVYLVLFSIPKLTVRADVIEFLDEP